MPPVTLKDIMKYFGMSSQEMTREWKALNEEDKAQIKNGLSDGSMTY
jgi:hypothetical protein